MSSLMDLKNVSKVYRLESGVDLRVLEGVNLSVAENEFVALLGPSGSGKSTCLRILGGLTPTTSGEVLSRGNVLRSVNRDVAMVFQSFALFPWETVQSNIALALDRLGLTPMQVKERVKRAVDIVGMEGFEEAYPRELSGGMKQRVGIARALVMDRPLLFLDEPFSALDVLTADTLRAEVVKIFLSRKTATSSVVMVTHNIQEAVFMAQRILVMGANPGHIRREIVNDLPYPRNDQSAAYLRMVAQIHDLITETLMPDVIPALPETAKVASSQRKESLIETLPRAQINEIIGLVEAISEKGGSSDIFELAFESGKDFGSTLYLVKAAELLDLVDTPKQKVILTELGMSFVKGDINVRKRMFHELFGGLRLVQMTANLLRNSEQLRVPSEEMLERLSEWLPRENPHELFETLVSWGRFAEYFGYSDDTKEVYLDIGQESA